MKTAKALRAEIKQLASARNLNMAALARNLRVTPQYLGDVFNGRRRLTPKMVKKAAKTLGVDATEAERWQRMGAIESGWEVFL